MFKKDRGQWVEVAAFDLWSNARYYARRLNFVQVDNPNEQDNWYYRADTWSEDYCTLKEELTGEQREELETDPQGMADKFGVALCRHCGSLLGLNANDGYVEINGNYFCDEECAESEDYFYCSHCDDWCHGNYYTTHNGDRICEDCYYDCYGTCDHCGDIYHTDELHYDDDSDCCYCDDCYEEYGEGNRIIKGYHSDYRPDIEIHKTCKDTPSSATFGTEVEAECCGSHDRDSVAKAIDQIVNKYEDLFMFEDDGSLSDQGYETISQPFTMNWFKENKDLFEKMFATMVTMGARSHDTSTCGFHVHFGKHFFGNELNKCVDRLLFLFEKYKPQLEVFSRRKNFNWCHFPSEMVDEPVEWSKLDEVKKLNKYRFEGHHSAINLENYDTIEIRIFRGTLNFNTYCATLELVNNIMHYVKDKSDEEVEKGKFEDILNFLPTEYLKQYCLDRNII